MQKHGLSVTGIHTHILDAAGHEFATQESELRSVYERLDELVGYVRGAVDDLLILSDHGMQVSYLDDDRPGAHSWRAVASTTVNEAPPTDVFGVQESVVSHATVEPRSDRSAALDTNEEQLRNLGYIE